MGAIRAAAVADGYETMIDGTKASDECGDRPGMKALTEMSVLSPLRLGGLTKAQIREFSREAGLFTWDKPAYPWFPYHKVHALFQVPDCHSHPSVLR